MPSDPGKPGRPPTVFVREDKGRLPQRIARGESVRPGGQELRGSYSGCRVALVTPPDPVRLIAPVDTRTIQPRPLQSAALQLRVLSRPVLKHGPRSLTCARVTGIKSKPRGAVKAWGPHGLCRRGPLREDGRSFPTGAGGQHSRGASAPAAGAPGAHTLGPERW